LEPNDLLAQANGPLRPQRDYFGQHNTAADQWDRFRIFVQQAGQVTVRVTHAGPNTLQLFFADQEDETLFWCRQTPCTIVCDAAAEMTYYLDVFMPDVYPTDVTYILRASFSSN